MKCDKKDLMLYAVTDSSWVGTQTLAQQVEQALEGGVTCVQWREKILDEAACFQEAQALKKLCEKYKVPFLINDHVDLAALIEADGVHVGQSDMETGEVRQKLGPDKIIGVSVQTVEQAILAEKRGADYLGVGAIFATDSKKDAQAVTLSTLKAICEAVSIPVIAIGGIHPGNIGKLKQSGICGVAVIRAIFGEPTIEKATKDLKKLVEEVLKS